MAAKTVDVPKISCGHCVKTILREVGELDGIRSVDADESTKRVTVEWDDDVRSWDGIRELLEEIGYPPAEA